MRRRWLLRLSSAVGALQRAVAPLASAVSCSANQLATIIPPFLRLRRGALTPFSLSLSLQRLRRKASYDSARFAARRQGATTAKAQLTSEDVASLVLTATRMGARAGREASCLRASVEHLSTHREAAAGIRRMAIPSPASSWPSLHTVQRKGHDVLRSNQLHTHAYAGIDSLSRERKKLRSGQLHACKRDDIAMT